MSPDAVTYCVLIEACKRTGRWERVPEIMESMRRSGVPLNVVAYSALISACQQAGQWERAFEVGRRRPPSSARPKRAATPTRSDSTGRRCRRDTVNAQTVTTRVVAAPEAPPVRAIIPPAQD